MGLTQTDIETIKEALELFMMTHQVEIDIPRISREINKIRSKDNYKAVHADEPYEDVGFTD